MGKASREKGKRGEREWAALCRQEGYDCHRTAQYRGNTGDAGDVEGLRGVHVEVKRTEALRPWEYMGQAIRDAEANGQGNMPVVAWRANNHDWLMLIRPEDFFRIYREWEAANG